ncbi:MAG: aminotransferase class I/II-fold pyridoxal phosphate-dependent enzyme [Acidimicrobiales bacterium]
MNSFDVSIETIRARRGKKWTAYGPDVLAAWVADMDFEPAPAILTATQGVLDRYDFGYQFFLDDELVIGALARWMDRQHNWKIDESSVTLFGDVLQALVAFINLYSEPGDGVVLQTPIYPPFIEAVVGTGRTIVDHQLSSADTGYQLDIDALAALIDDRTRILMLANPHNPTGRVFSREELTGLGELAVKHDLLILADEIHADLIWDGTHIPFATIDPRFEERCVTLTSATKSFNIAGLRVAAGIMGSPAIKERFETFHRFFWGGVNSMGAEATIAAWTECDDWLDGLRSQLLKNRQTAVERINAMPGLSTVAPEATFLLWIDCSELIEMGVTDRPFRFFVDNGVALNNGHDFGPHGTSHVRLNFATSEAVLGMILDKMEAAVS